MTGIRSLVAAALLIASSASAAWPAPAPGTRAGDAAARVAAARLVAPPWLAAMPRPAPPASGPLTLATSDLLVILRDAGALRVGAGARAESAEPGLAATLARAGIARAAVVGHARADATRARILKLSSDRADFDPLEAARALRATGRFRAVTPNYRLRLFPTLPNDPYLTDQWYVQDLGDDDVDLPEAWDLEQGGADVVIGVMDTGVDTGHPDLAGRIWTNPGEVPGNSLDDDGNGYADDVNGWDFGTDDADPNPHAVIDPIGLDIGFHGTFVAGIASATTNNGQGIAGAGWNCRILPLKVVDAAGDITSEAVAEAFLYAADLQIGVLNMSLGGPGNPGVPEFFQALVDVADSAGVMCVAAAGNDGVDTPSYPAACERVLAVAATEQGELRASFSNYGSWVDIAAPGAMMWSTICRNYVIDDVSQIFYLYFFLWDGENPYMYNDGTSFACPLVAGACGLVRHRFPALTPQQVAQRMVTTGDAITYDQPIGPKLNAHRAVSAPLVAVEDGPAAGFGFDRLAPNPFRSATTLSFTTVAPGPVRLRLYDFAGRLVREIASEHLPAGPHTRTWNGADASGHALPSGVYFATLESGVQVARGKIVLLR